MHIIQILIPGLSFLFIILFFTRFRTRFIDIIIIMVISIFAGFLAFFPNVANKIANFLGIGRGADMLTYLGFIFSVFMFFKMYNKIDTLQKKLTALNRYLALRDYKDLTENSENEQHAL